MKRALLGFVATLPLLAVSLPSESGLDALNYSRRWWQSQDGLPEDFAQSVAQTPDGYLWTGTSGGLVRFDGIRFATFNPENEPAFRDASVYALLTTKDGTLWIGTEGGGLVRYRAGAFRAYGPAQGLTNGFVRCIYEDRRGALWAGADRGLFRMDGETWTRVDGKNGIPSLSVHTIWEDQRGRLLVGGRGLLVLGDKGPAYYQSAINLADNSVRTISESPDGAIWMGTVGGLRRLGHGVQGDPFLSPKLIDDVNISVLRSSGDAMWIGTYGHGLIRYESGNMIRITAPQGLPHNNVLAVFEDREGDVWVGTQGGLQRMSPSVARTITTPDGVPQSMNTVYEDSNGLVLVTSLSGSLFEVKAKHLVPYRPMGSAVSLPIRNTLRARDGTLWLGTNGHGIIRVGHGTPVRYAMKQGLINDFVRAFCEDRAGSLWIGTDGGLSRWRNGRFENFDAGNGLVYGSIRALVEDSHGTLWIGTDGGLSRFRDTAFVADARLDSLRGQKVWAFFEDRTGGMWIGTHGSGLFQWKNGKLSQFATRNGIPSNIHFIVEDQTGNLWLSSPAGVFSVARKDLEAAAGGPPRPIAVRLYGTSEGLSTNQMNGGVQAAGALSQTGELLFPSTKGVVALTPGSPRRAAPPQVFVEQVQADDRSVPLGPVLRLSPGRRKLEIHYTAIRLRSPERLRFSYWMENLENEWTNAGGRRIAYYTNVPPGDFRFHVMAYDVDDPQHGAEQVLPIHSQPPFYRAWWFTAACTLAILAMAWGAYQLHARSVRKRFAAVLAERNRLAREMHDTVIQGCVGVSALLEAASSAQEISPELSRTMLERARNEIRATVEDARSAVWNLRQNVDGDDILCALSRLVDRVRSESGVMLELKSSGTPVPLGAEAERSLLLSVREAIQNAVRHASPRNIIIKLDFESSRLNVRIEDDGSGFEFTPGTLRDARHYGLIGMRERVEKLGGKFDLASSPGRGTVVRLTIPRTGLLFGT